MVPTCERRSDRATKRLARQVQYKNSKGRNSRLSLTTHACCSHETPMTRAAKKGRVLDQGPKLIESKSGGLRKQSDRARGSFLTQSILFERGCKTDQLQPRSKRLCLARS